MQKTGTRLLILFIVCLLVFTLLRGLKGFQVHMATTEQFIDIPHEIKADYRDDVNEFLEHYFALGQQVCSVQTPVIDGIAKITLGVQQGSAPTKQEIAAAAVRAKDMAGGPLFNCTTFASQTATVAKDPLTIKDLYTVFDDIPDTVGLRMYTSAKFAVTQLGDTYKQIEGTLSSALQGTLPVSNEGFTDIPEGEQQQQQQQPSRCKATELCPEEMSQEILQRLPKLKASLDQATKGFLPSTTPLSDLLKEATEYNTKLTTLKERAQAGTLIGPPAS